MKPAKLSHEDAEVIALKALGFLARDPERLGRFLALSGIDPAHIRVAAQDSRFLTGVLSHLLGDESLLLTFVADENLDPRLPALAAEVLARASA